MPVDAPACRAVDVTGWERHAQLVRSAPQRARGSYVPDVGELLGAQVVPITSEVTGERPERHVNIAAHVDPGVHPLGNSPRRGRYPTTPTRTDGMSRQQRSRYDHPFRARVDLPPKSRHRRL